MNKEFYDHHYSEMQESRLAFWKRAAAVKAQNVVKLSAGMRVKRLLDVGCGPGLLLGHLSRAGIAEQYYAIDISDVAIDALLRGAEIPGLAEARVFDGRRIPYADDYFDLVTVSHVIEHIPEPQYLLQEIARVAPFAVIEVPLEDNLYTHLKVGLFRSDYRRRIGHVQWFNRRSFLALLSSNSSFEVVRYRLVEEPDELYLFRKKELPRTVAAALLAFRNLTRRITGALYSRLRTVNCAALVRRISDQQQRDAVAGR